MPKTWRVCSVPDCPEYTQSSRCETHARPSREARGYGHHHRTLRAQWQTRIDRGEIVTCWRCGRVIDQGDPWDLGHDDHDRTITHGPEHLRCNRATAGRHND